MSDVGIYLGDGPFSIDSGLVNLHPSKGMCWVAYLNGKHFDSNGCFCLKKLSKFIIKRNGNCLYSEYQIQGLTIKKDSYCASYYLYIIYMTEVLGIVFKSAVLNLYYQMI